MQVLITIILGPSYMSKYQLKPQNNWIISRFSLVCKWNKYYKSIVSMNIRILFSIILTS